MKIKKNKNGQAIANQTVFIDEKSFENHQQTEIRWLGNASIMINSYGHNIMIDPLLEGFDMPLLIDMPILPTQIPYLDAIFITHIDNDHFSELTCQDVKAVCQQYHAPYYVADVMKEKGINAIGHSINESFMIHDIEVTLTKAKHNWQNNINKYQYRIWKEEDYCGYSLKTKDGTIWLPGDSKLLEEHLHREEPDVILFDFSDNEWHMTLQGAIELANAYLHADLICIHWGSVDAPTMTPFNGNPEDLYDKIINPQRIKVLAPGELYILK